MEKINNSSLVAEKFYSAECGRCGKVLADQKGYQWRHDAQSVEEDVKKAGWQKIDNLHYCPDCCHYSKERGRYVIKGRENDYMRGDVVYMMNCNKIVQGIISSRNDDGTLVVRLKPGIYVRYKEKDIFRSSEALAQYLVFSYRQSNQ